MRPLYRWGLRRERFAKRWQLLAPVAVSSDMDCAAGVEA